MKITLLKSFLLKGLNLDKLERYRFGWTIDNLKKIPKKSSIIDIGAGEQVFKQFCSHLNYTSQDQGSYDGSGTEGLHTGEWDTSDIDIVCDAAALPIDDAVFDAFLCTEVLEHATNPIDILRECSRITKSGGIGIITAPAASLTPFAPYYFHTGFLKYFFEHYAEKFSFKVKHIQYIGGIADRIISQCIASKDKRYHANPFKRVVWIAICSAIIFLCLILRKMENSFTTELSPSGVLVVYEKR